MTVTFRKTDRKDIEILMTMRMETIRHVNHLPEDYVFTGEMLHTMHQYFLHGDQLTVIAEDNGEAIACASISYYTIMPSLSHTTGHRAHIMNVYTREAYRRQGIAKTLVQMLVDDAKMKGATEISLDATEMGRPVYLSLGFTATSEGMVMKL